MFKITKYLMREFVCYRFDPKPILDKSLKITEYTMAPDYAAILYKMSKGIFFTSTSFKHIFYFHKYFLFHYFPILYIFPKFFEYFPICVDMFVYISMFDIVLLMESCNQCDASDFICNTPE